MSGDKPLQFNHDQGRTIAQTRPDGTVIIFVDGQEVDLDHLLQTIIELKILLKNTMQAVKQQSGGGS